MKVTYKRETKKQQQEKQLTTEPPDCLICCEPIELYAIFECDHNEVCGKCVLIQRGLMDDKKCCICKQETNNLYVTTSLPRKHANYDPGKFIFDEKLKVYLENKKILSTISEWRNFKCRPCEIEGKTVEFKNIDLLKKHCSTKHNLFYCDLCLKQRKVFQKDQKLYTHKQLQIHQRQGEIDPESGLIKGHPNCKFCHQKFYSDDELFSHMHLNHYDCHICKQQGFQFEYFKNYDELQKHYETDHFACTHPFCLEQSNDLDLKAHEFKNHSKNKKIDIDLFSQGGNSGSKSSSNTKFKTSSIKQGRKIFKNGVIDASIIRFVNFSTKEGQSEYNLNMTPTFEIPDNLKQLQIEYKLEKEKQIEIQKEKEKEIKLKELEEKKKEEVKLKKKKSEELIQKMKKMLSQKEKLFEEFKATSIQFQKGRLDSSIYYQILLNTFGEENSKKILPDLIETMPEKNKKLGEELTKIHQQNLSSKNKKKKGGKKGPKTVIPSNTVKEDWPTFGESTSKK
eukprot:gene9164-1252_t